MQSEMDDLLKNERKYALLSLLKNIFCPGIYH
jgi:hypothetical protein